MYSDVNNKEYRKGGTGGGGPGPVKGWGSVFHAILSQRTCSLSFFGPVSLVHPVHLAHEELQAKQRKT